MGWITQYPEKVKGSITKRIGVSPAGQSAKALIIDACKWAEDDLLGRTFPHGTHIKFKLEGYSIERGTEVDDITAEFSYVAELR